MIIFLCRMPNTECEHGKDKYYCQPCGGKGICEHGKRKNICKECGGGSICEHGKRKQGCRECGGSNFCKHNRVKYSAPIVVSLVTIFSIYRAVFSPGLMPGTKPPCFLKLSAVSVGLKVIDV